ncbi:MAG: histidine kinase [Nakamurella sp.]
MVISRPNSDTRGWTGRDFLTPAVTWLVATGILIALPMASSGDAELAAGIATLGSARWWWVMAVVTGQSCALIWARVAPPSVLIAVVTVSLPIALLQPAATYSLTSIPLVVALYLAGSKRPFAQIRAAVILASALLGAGFVVSNLSASSGVSVTLVLAAVAQTLVLIAVPLAVAFVVATRRELRKAQARALIAVEREQEAVVHAAIAEERMGLARELHDIAAHHMSGIALMASAIERQIDSAPEEAKVGVREVRTQSRLVLDDMRRLVGLLRDTETPGTSVQSLAAVSDLVKSFGGDERHVEFQLHRANDSVNVGDGVGPLAQLTGYRMVQEALANASRHAPGARCVVTLDDRNEKTVLLTVLNAASVHVSAVASAGGFGLRGMVERAMLVGADLRYGATIDGGWEVRLGIPRSEIGAAHHSDMSAGSESETS